MDTAFITGVSGFVGAAVARTLLRQGLKVRGLVRATSNRAGIDALDIELVQGDLLDGAAIARGVAGCRYVFHVAADYRIWAPEPGEMYRSNVDGTEHVLRAAAKAGAERIVYCSSVAAIKAPRDRTPSDESSEYAHAGEVIGPYKKSKYLADVLARRLARDEGLPVVVVNPATPVGPGDARPTPTGKIVVDFLGGRMPAYVDTGLCVVHVDDVAHGHWLAATQGRIGERYVLGGENMTFKQMLDLLAAASGLRAPRVALPYSLVFAFGALDSAWARLRGTEPTAPLDAIRMASHYMWFSSGKAQRELGYSPRPAAHAVQDAVAWYTAHGYAPARREESR